MGSWYRVFCLRDYWLTHLCYWLFSSMTYCGTSQIVRLHGGGVNLFRLLRIVLQFYSLIMVFKLQWFSMWCHTSISLAVPRKTWWDTTYLCPPPLYWTWPHLCLRRIDWWEVVIVFLLGLGCLILPPGYLLGPGSLFYGYIPKVIPWYTTPGCKTDGILTLCCTSKYLLDAYNPWNPHL